MAQLPTGPQFGVKYTITGPDGTVAVFNDSTDPSYVGTLSDVTGLDSPDVRESAEELIQQDGGIHGDFYYGRRPITMTGLIYGHDTATVRNTRTTRFMQATSAMRGDAVIKWTPEGGVEQYVNVRRQQPLRITGGWNKDFQLAVVAADPRIYSTTLHTSAALASDPGGVSGFTFDRSFDISFGPGVITGQVTPENQGNTTTYPITTIAGPITNPVLYNASINQYVTLIYTLNAGETLVVDHLNRTVLLNGSTSRYSAVDYGNTNWFGLVPGVNDIRLLSSAAGSPSSISVAWRDAWL